MCTQERKAHQILRKGITLRICGREEWKRREFM
jgi:hypothetical protein